MTAPTFTDPKTDPPRDQWGRPKIKPADGGPPVAYTRVTTLAGTVEDHYNLELWKQRQVTIGLSLRPDLLALAASGRDDKTRLDQVVAQALDAASTSARANLGTALHALTETVDRGGTLAGVPTDLVGDLDAYQSARDAAGLDVVDVEGFVVVDQLQVAGTFDRIYRLRDGSQVIGDLKTGASIDLAAGAIAIQLACYAHGAYYQAATGERTPLPDVDQIRALIVHAPAGKATCSLHWIDIHLGWAAADLAAAVREYRRKAKGLLSAADLDLVDVDVFALVAAAATVDQLIDVYRANQAVWSPALNAAAAARKDALTKTR